MRTTTRRVATLVAAGMLTGLVATAAVASTSDVNQTVNAGERQVTLSAIDGFTALDYSHSDQASTGTGTLTVDDLSGSDAGWNASIVASDFSDGTNSIPASELSFAAAAPTHVDGDPIGESVRTVNAAGTLDTASAVLEADAGAGMGQYDQALGLSLNVPGGTLAGSYSSTVTSTIAAGPTS